jgi:23S rRNA (adenine2503-C2)-methyltransferase
MRFRDGRRSICVSSQSGCPLTCTFCATGAMKFARNLTASEIVDQALHFRRMEPIDHCVFMGMGEPMLNLDAVLAACERLPDIGITHRRTTISTVGWIPGIERLADCDMPVRLALSLHAAEDALRSELMPVNERYPLAEVIEAARAFYERKRRRIFIEYVMLAGVNDRYQQALALARLLAPRELPRRPGARPPRRAGGSDGPVRDAQPTQIFKVNLIPYNPTGSPYEGSSRESIAAFRTVLQSHGIDATVRLTRGRDIAAACGQLAAQSA